MKITKKQEPVVELLMQGLTLKQIARQLNKPYDSVKSLSATFLKSNGYTSFHHYLLFEISVLKEEQKSFKQEIAYYKRYKHMWDELKRQTFEERRR